MVTFDGSPKVPLGGVVLLIEDIKSQFGKGQIKEGIHHKSLFCTRLIKGFILVVSEFWEPV